MAIEVPAEVPGGMAVGQTYDRRPRRASAGVLALLAALTLGVGGCAAGRDAQTAYQKPTLDGIEATIGSLSLSAITIDAPTSAAYYPKGSSAPMRLVLVNSGDTADTLTAVSSPAFAGWAVVSSASAPQAEQSAAAAGGSTSPSPSSGASSASVGTQRVTLPANARVPFGTPEASNTLLLTKLAAPAHPGSALPITFTFARAGAVTVQVPVGLTKNPPISIIPSAGAGG